MECFDNVWDALGFDALETASLKARSDLMIRIEQTVRAAGWTQVEAARRCGISQPRMNALLRGKIEKFSLDALVDIATSLGFKVSVEIKAA
jgi:predicted XRE-type DNA-binding protein